MRRKDFIFHSVQILYYKCHKINFKRGGSYTDCPDCIKKKKATINPKNTDGKCFQYAVTVALNYEETESQKTNLNPMKKCVKIKISVEL